MSGYAIVALDMVDDLTIPRDCVMTWLALSSVVGADERPTYREVAKKARLTLPKFVDALASLKEIGWLEFTDSGAWRLKVGPSTVGVVALVFG